MYTYLYTRYASNDSPVFHRKLRTALLEWICLENRGAYYGPHEGRTGYPIKSTNANPMAYDETVAKALWEASEKVPKNVLEVWCTLEN